MTTVHGLVQYNSPNLTLRIILKMFEIAFQLFSNIPQYLEVSPKLYRLSVHNQKI